MGNKPSKLHERSLASRSQTNSSNGSGSSAKWKARLHGKGGGTASAGVAGVSLGTAPKLEVVPAPDTAINGNVGVSSAEEDSSKGANLHLNSAPRLNASNSSSSTPSTHSGSSAMSPATTVPCQVRDG